MECRRKFYAVVTATVISKMTCTTIHFLIQLARTFLLRFSCRLLKEISNNLHRTFRQRIEKGLAVLLRQNPVVQNHDDARVRLRADQASDALPEFQDRLGQRKFAEGISTARLDPLQPRLDERMVRHRER